MASRLVSNAEVLVDLIRRIKTEYPNEEAPIQDLWDVLYPYWTSEDGKPGTGTLRADTPDNIIETCLTIARMNLRRLHLLSGNTAALVEEMGQSRSSLLTMPRGNGKTAAMQAVVEYLASGEGNNK